MELLQKRDWVPDRKAKVCMCCNNYKFTFSNRRHHCRTCGYVVCAPCSSRKHPQQTARICKKCYSKIMIKTNGLHNCGWYHGPLTRQATEQRFSSPMARAGDYLVRESASVDGFLAVSVKIAKGVHHFLIHEYGGRWYMGNEVPLDNVELLYESVQELITNSAATYGLERAMIVEGLNVDVCPSCQTTNTPGQQFCDGCGTRLNSTKEQRDIYEDGGDMGGGGGAIYEGQSYMGGPAAIYDDQSYDPPQATYE